MTGRIHSFETLSGIDGPGMRCVVFLQGCPLRCRYCHNPDTWQPVGGESLDARDVVARAVRYRPYFGNEGGVTLSGGEPLLQAPFAAEILAGLRQANIHTALDTAGLALTDAVRACLANTDLVLLDIKHTDPQKYRELTGGELSTAVEFLRYVQAQRIAFWVRQVIVPGWNDTPEQVRELAAILRAGPTPFLPQKVELLAYHSMAKGKWEALGMTYPLADTPEMDTVRLAELQKIVDAEMNKP